MSSGSDLLRALIYTYLIVSGLLVLGYVGFAGVYIGLQHNPSAVYCDYDVSAEEANFVNESGEPCRIRAWVFIESGILGLIILAAIQWPAYLYFLVGYIRRWRARKREAVAGQ